MLEPQRLQGYLRDVVARTREGVPVGPFTLFVDRHTDHPFLNYAIPETGARAWPAEAIAALRDACTERGRVARLEFVVAAAPGLAEALAAGGFDLEAELAVMVCTPATLAHSPRPPGMTIETVGATAPPVLVRDLISAQREAFGESPAVADGEVARFVRVIGAGAGLLARVDGEPAAGAQYTSPAGGLAELAGIGTRPRFRRRGLAGALTAATAAHAFAHGADTAFLTPGDDGAQRVYERAGFTPVTRMVHMRVPGRSGNG
ncbi:MAG: putative GCN5-related N-acetyltransferase [Solirubrobacterales bacterium]|nr:putative GCN5-related N-acetyltransferase [Solirubrobacterales bacterium]